MTPCALARGLAVALATTQLVACATLINTPFQKVQLDSAPAGAEVVIEPGRHRITTPGEVRLKRDTRYLAIFELAGHASEAKQLNPQISGWIWGGFLMLAVTLAGFAVIAVDLATGSAYHLEPDPVHVELEPSFDPYPE